MEALREKIKALFADRKKVKILLISAWAAVALLAILLGCAIYLNDCYRADGEAVSEATGSFTDIEIYELRDGVTVYAPEAESGIGLIFYPGGKVECSSYAPLMAALASRGITAVLCEMPFNLAVLNVNAAEGIRETIPEVESWYIGGHSLGGSMAASYLASNKDSIDGLVLLGSYSTADVSDCPVISVYGENDGVMNREKYEQYKPNLPADFEEHIISGGNHAYFGMYGEQEGDGKASITPEEQIAAAADIIAEFVK